MVPINETSHILSANEATTERDALLHILLLQVHRGPHYRKPHRRFRSQISHREERSFSTALLHLSFQDGCKWTTFQVTQRNTY